MADVLPERAADDWPVRFVNGLARLGVERLKWVAMSPSDDTRPEDDDRSRSSQDISDVQNIFKASPDRRPRRRCIRLSILRRRKVETARY
jgi:hypothetical protein